MNSEHIRIRQITPHLTDQEINAEETCEVGLMQKEPFTIEGTFDDALPDLPYHGIGALPKSSTRIVFPDGDALVFDAEMQPSSVKQDDGTIEVQATMIPVGDFTREHRSTAAIRKMFHTSLYRDTRCKAYGWFQYRLRMRRRR